jgi:hypothetical protein
MSARILMLIRFLAASIAASDGARRAVLSASLLKCLRKLRHAQLAQTIADRLVASVTSNPAVMERIRRHVTGPVRRVSAQERAREARLAARRSARPSRARMPWMFRGLGDGTPFVDNAVYMRADAFQTFFG